MQRFLYGGFMVLCFAAAARSNAELKQGRYIGSITLSDTGNKIAVVSDFYLESPEDLKLFPALHASLKLSFGGYNTHEYITEIFDDVRYDFDNGILTLDDPKNDLAITAELEKKPGKPRIIGDVFIRSSAVFGKLLLEYETDEPGDDGEPPAANGNDNFIALLEGQYEGKCSGERAVLQLQTVRGLKTAWQAENEASSLSRYYGISARIGLRDSIMCGSLPPGLWCGLVSYAGGSYNAYQGKLILRGSATDDCTVERDSLKCEIRRTGWNRTCEFKRLANKIKIPKFFSRRFNLNGTSEQLKELPAADPPKNQELSAALRGVFAGYLHNETNDTYQFLRLNVLPFSFTDNPHNPNQMMIISSATLHLGRDATGPYITQRFEPRSFYLRPGFTLSGPTTDTFVNISEWKKGFIRGVMYSHAFGRVGTVQLVKGTPPTAPAAIQMLRSFAGEYDGPLAKDGVSAKLRWFRFLFPVQPNDVSDHLIRFSGSFNPAVGISPVHNIDRGTFDPFTGNLGWILEHEGAATFSSGYLDENNNIRMYWPPAPGIFGVRMSDYIAEIFGRK